MYIKHAFRTIILFTLLAYSGVALANISQADLKLTKQVISTIKNNNFENAKKLIAQMKSPAAKQVGLFALYRSNGYRTDYREIENFIKKYPNWKNLASLKSIMEKRIFSGQYDVGFAKNWFKKYPAKTALGKLYNAEQYFNTGQTKRGQNLLRSVWRNSILSEGIEKSTVQKMGQYLENWDHKLRADMLMNKGRSKSAIANAGFANDAYVRFFKARAALENRKSKDALGLFKKTPKSLAEDMGLKYSLLLYYFNKRDDMNALKILESVATKKQNVAYRSHYWRIKFRVIHRLLNRKYDKNIKLRAFKLLAAHQQPVTSIAYVDAEFKAGWIALTYLGDYKLAKTHFDNAEKRAMNVRQKPRGYYWQAQLARKLNKQSDYILYLNKAVKFQYNFYGQLAGERIGKSEIFLPRLPISNKAFLNVLNENDNADFIKIYNSLGQAKQLKYHYTKLQNITKTSENMMSLIEFAKLQKNPHYAVNTARRGLLKGWDMHREAYPDIKLPAFKTYTGRPEKALTYALIRQESVFDQYATSHSGAKGYMQIIRTTGSYLAKKYKVPYKNEWLHSKPELNLALGNSYLYDLIQNQNGSYVLALAAYNGGGTWVKRWVEANGDPRINEVKFVNWIESMPKAETRNYVKKVTKNIQIFNIRFNGNKGRTNLIGTLTTGSQ